MVVTSRAAGVGGVPGAAPPDDATLANIGLARPRFDRLIAEI